MSRWRSRCPQPIEIVPMMVPTRLPRKIDIAAAATSGPRDPIVLPKQIRKPASSQIFGWRLIDHSIRMPTMVRP